MEFKTASGLIRTGEVLCDCGADILLEGEYTVPDYQPEIFRVLHTCVRPVLLQKAAVGRTAGVEGYAEVTVSYQGPENGALCTAQFKIPFSRQFELNAAADSFTDVRCFAQLQYLSCSALSPRRLQAGGSLTLQLTVLSYAQRQTVQDVAGPGVQQLHFLQPVCSKTAQTEHRFALDEMLEMDLEGCESPAVLRSEAYLQLQPPQREDGRVSVSGSVLLSVTVRLRDDRILHSGYEIPFRQLLSSELPGGEALLTCSGSCSSVNIVPAVQSNILHAAIGCTVELAAYSCSEEQLLGDVFSTEYETQVRNVCLPFLSAVQPFTQEISLQAQIACEPDAQLLDWGIGSLQYADASQGEDAAVTAEFFCLLRQSDGSISAKQTAATLPFSAAHSPGLLLHIGFAMRQCEAAKQGGTLRFSVCGTVQGLAGSCSSVQAVESVEPDETGPKTPWEFPLAVHYAAADESVWDIAKRFNTSAQAIAEENARVQNDVSQSGLLLIPMA